MLWDWGKLEIRELGQIAPVAEDIQYESMVAVEHRQADGGVAWGQTQASKNEADGKKKAQWRIGRRI